MNLCTDQLAMLVAGPDQLMSVSDLALDSDSSAMVDRAGSYIINHGRAEEIYVLKPDLVVAGAYSDPATLGMLRRLGVRVEVFEPALSLDEVRDRVAQMGDVLGQDGRAADLLAAFDTRRDRLRPAQGNNPRAALYYPNGYTLGDETLAGALLAEAGFDNVAEELGLSYGGAFPLELLLMTAPDTVMTSPARPGKSRSEDILVHPALASLREGAAGLTLTPPDWMCGTPFALNALDVLVAHRAEILSGVSE
ncbi:ABC transporter substrate-binding protein (plasmid) [Qingshengfaniella alkalisoli]|uniref:ABC transporter substrate-binding protein n=2 Tax=Qingshengfaniella alkalisoli TaxID=2599296 RepID=A0A5B8JBZ0_9RHOB|nr:ABC transporter substrate-binding protein [Qingshengfaniella alkalisoli]